MRKWSLKLKLIRVLFSLVLSFCCALGVFGTSDYSVYAITTSDISSYVSVGELWDSSSKSFNSDNIKILYKYLTANANATISDVESLIASTEYAQVPASTIRANAIASGTQGTTTYETKTSSKDIVVTLGGLTWTVTYLSDDMDGNPILTLWLSNSTQSAWADRTSDEGEYYGFIDGGLYSDWSYNFQQSKFTNTYPSSVYGSSYIRAITLNNGGDYATSISTIALAEQSEDSVFAEFTMPKEDETDLTEFLVTPSRVQWQQYQSSKTSVGLSYPNDAWADDVCNTLTTDPYSNTYNFHTDSSSGQGNYSGASANPNEYNDAWINDYLWLPSITETRGSDTYLGMWGLSITQRQNYDGSTTATVGNVGTSSGAAYARSWLRSGNFYSAHDAYYFYPAGSSTSTSIVTCPNAVRPALHLNLKAVEENAKVVEVEELWDSESKTINEDNAKILLKYITGKKSATFGDVANLAQYTHSASKMRANTLDTGIEGTTSYSSKSAEQDIVVTLGGLKWHVTYLSEDMDGNPILTLWLSNSTQEAFAGRSATEGEYYGFIDGGLYSNFTSYMSNMSTYSSPYPLGLYSTSYINSVTLNNGGLYSTSLTSATTYSQSESSVFAKFTMPVSVEKDLTDFIVTPSRVIWQKYQSAYGQNIISYSLPNDAWSDEICNSYIDELGYDYKFNSNASYGEANYSGASANPNKYNGVWKNNYLWLPSLSEVGYNEIAGIWDLSTDQKYNYDGVTGKDVSIGVIGGKNVYVNTYLRSGTYNNSACNHYLSSNGETHVDYGSGSVAMAVRPALHLNLTAIMAEMDFVEVGELWDDSKSEINQDNLSILFKYITGRTNAKYADINSLAESTFTAQQMRSTTISTSGVSGLSKYSSKSLGQDIVVTLGGLKWHVTYLSKDMDGNPILTLWLSNSTQDAFSGRSATEGEFYGFTGSGMYSAWSGGWSGAYFTDQYPSNMYGTSYMSVVTLNNGGYYSIDADTLSDEVQPSSNSVFAEFTIPQDGVDLTDYLVTPSNVQWQESQSFFDLMGTSLPNEAWGSTVPNSGTDTYGSNYLFEDYGYGIGNFATHSQSSAYNDDWADDYLWLPSLYESGYGVAEYAGMWELSDTQRANADESDENLDTGVVIGLDSAYNSPWLRSGNYFNAIYSYYLNPSGSTGNVRYVDFSAAVRPALHLNLKAMVDDSDFVEVGELWNENSTSMDENNVNILLKYLTGDSSDSVNDPTILDDVNTLASSVTTAADLRAIELSEGNSGGVDYGAKSNGQDIIVTLGGLKWHVTYLSQDMDGNPILTLWLSNSTQDAFNGRTDGGKYYLYDDGNLLACWSYQIYSSASTQTYPPTMYGTSYVRAVVLNNGGLYATSTSTSAVADKSASNVFSKFTMNDDETVDITDFLVVPSSVSWQENSSSKGIVNSTYNLPNDSWSTETSDYALDYTGYEGYDAWKNDYIWLPGASEIWSNNCKWQVSTNQILNSVDTWLRSSNYNQDYHCLYLGPEGGVGWGNTGWYKGIRPALHINLKKLIYGPGTNDLTDTDKAEIYLDQNSSEYDGMVKRPNVVVNYNGQGLVWGKDYILIYKKDGVVVDEIKDAGFYTIVVRGIGLYENDVHLEYVVTKKSIETLTISDIPEHEYTGRAITPLVLLESDLPMVKDVDYTLSYLNNINAGTATVIVTGIGNYEGTISTTFNIVGRDINDADTLYVADIISPNKDIAIKLAYEGRLLIKDTDYTLSYSDNINYGECIVTITGIGGWLGTRTVTAEVGQMSIVDNVAVMFSFKDVLFSETAQEPVVRLIYFDRDLVKDTDYTITFYRGEEVTTDFTNTGTITILITGINDWTDEYSNSYSILQKNISASSISVLGLKDTEWTGDEINPEIVLLNNGVEIDAEDSYDYEISNNTDVGVATIKLTGKGNYKGTRILTFNITKATPVVDVVYDEDSVYYEGYSAPEITLNSASIPGTFKVTNSDKLVIGNNAYNWTFTPEDSEHYSVVNGTTEIVALKDDVIGMKLSGSYKTKYQALSTLDTSDIIVGLEFISGKILTLTSDECNYSVEGVLQVGDIIIISPKDYPEISRVLDIEIKPIEIAITFDNYTGIKENGEKQNIDVLVNGKNNTIIPLKVTYLNTRLNTESDSINEYGDYVVNVEILDGNYVISSIEPCRFSVEKNNFESTTNSNVNILLHVLISTTILSLIATIMFIQNSRKKFERFKKFSTVHKD